jgi:BlaI family penicillinase repressor
MAELPSISEAEWAVMQVVWQRSPIGAGEVVDELAGLKKWNHRTVRTLLNRLVKKKALGFHTDANRYLYFPRVTRAQCVRSEGKSFVSRVFGGAIGPMLVHFVNESPLSADEIRELKRLLSSKEK